jgi:predicted dehydrogenase
MDNLAIGESVERRTEKLRLVLAKWPKDLADFSVVRNIALPASRNENFGAKALCFLKKDNVSTKSRGPPCGNNPGSAGTDDDHVWHGQKVTESGTICMVKRIGLIGCGSVADFGHVPAILSLPDFDLAAIYDPNPDHLDQFLRKFGPRPAFTRIEEFWATALDAVTIASPAPAHYQNVMDAAKHGVHVLCEKPIAMNHEEGDAMQSAMAAAGKLFAIGYCYRFSPVAMRIRELVQGGAIGIVRSLRMHYLWNLHGIYEPGSRTYSPARRARMDEGGPMVDCGVHSIDLARWWLGSEVTRISGEGAWVEDYEAPDHVYAHLDHANGAHTCVEMSFTYTHTAIEPISWFHYHVIGTDGVILYDRDGGRFEVRNHTETQHLPWSHEKNFTGMYQEWQEALTSGTLGHMPSAADGIKATTIARQATEQAIANRSALGNL